VFTWPFVVLLLGAYLLGAVPTAYLMARWRRGIDIRRFGSGNVGLSNAIATGSKWTTIVVAAFDFLKGAIPVLLARLAHMPVYQEVAVGMAAICGHNWTVFLRFNGGRGVLTTLGVVFELAPWLGVTLLVANLLWAPFKQFALGTFFVLIMMPVLSWFLSGVFQIERSLALTLGFAAIFLLLALRRLTVPRSALASTVPMGELAVNRLLFDRDIRDRKAWLGRKSSPAADSTR
jgi:acyl phosphate:glycerol-3-phosphate acyltransferase